MDVKIERLRESLKISLKGELDQHEARGVLMRLGELESQALPARCVLDLSALGFTDSSGIAVLLGLERRVRDAGGELTVINIPPQARRVFDAAGLSRVMRFE